MAEEQKTYPDMCVCCGSPVPEGRMVCFACEDEDIKIVPKERKESPLKSLWGFAVRRRKSDEH